MINRSKFPKDANENCDGMGLLLCLPTLSLTYLRTRPNHMFLRIDQGEINLERANILFCLRNNKSEKTKITKIGSYRRNLVRINDFCSNITFPDGKI